MALLKSLGLIESACEIQRIASAGWCPVFFIEESQFCRPVQLSIFALLSLIQNCFVRDVHAVIMTRLLSRRTLLVGGAAAMSGCGALPFTSPSPNRMDLHIVNQSELNIEYDLRIHKPAADPFFEKSGELRADDGNSPSVTYANPITEPGEYQLVMETSNDLNIAFWWDDQAEPAKQSPDHDGITLTLYSDRWNVQWVDTRVDP
jgi:hypothetical protein